jgi:cation diffusion facilitator CzcD-associated flavoprotein CzcO
MATELPTFPTFADYAAYLEAYARNFQVRYQTTVTATCFDPVAQLWTISAATETETSHVQCRHLVIASGWFTPACVTGVNVHEDFGRPVYEANQMPHPDEFAGKTVLVVGMGNTGADVGMALVQAGARVVFGIRSIPTISSVRVMGLRLHDMAKCTLLLGQWADGERYIG